MNSKITIHQAISFAPETVGCAYTGVCTSILCTSVDTSVFTSLDSVVV